MSIKDNYYNNRSVDYHSNNLTIDVGTFIVNGDLAVSGEITSSEEASVNLSTNSDLYITGNSNWYFNNDDKSLFIFNDQYKKIAIGFDPENRSVTFDNSFRDNPIFFFSGTTDFGNYGTITGSNFVARFENFSNSAGASGVNISLNETNNQLNDTNLFLSFSGYSGSLSTTCGTISGVRNSEGIRIRGISDLVLAGDEVEINSGGAVSIGSSGFFVDVDGSSSPTQIRFQDSSGDSGHTLSKFVFANKSVEDTDIFIEFRDQSGALGSIRGGVSNNAFIGKDGVSGTTTEFAAYGNTGGNQLIRGNINTGSRGVSYYSFGSDFGEYFYYNDISEFSDGIQEGFVVYVKGDEFFKEKVTGSFPMIVTKRAAFIGNDRNDDRKKEVLSFVGQVYVLIKGKCKSGDYIVPEGNHCYAIDSEKISFSEYKKSMGRCLFDKQNEDVGHVKCVISLK
jgi:hypothetical protein